MKERDVIERRLYPIAGNVTSTNFTENVFSGILYETFLVPGKFGFCEIHRGHVLQSAVDEYSGLM